MGFSEDGQSSGAFGAYGFNGQAAQIKSQPNGENRHL